MSIAETLRQRFADQMAEGPQCIEVGGIGTVCWRPTTGAHQIKIEAANRKSPVHGICEFVRIRALDEQGAALFKGVTLDGMVHDFDFSDIQSIFMAIGGVSMSDEDVEKN